MGKLDHLNPNSWADTIRWCKHHNVKSKDVFEWISKQYINRTDHRTFQIGMLVHDKLKLNKKKKNPLTTRAVILNLARHIRKISGKELTSNERVYGVGYKSLKRTPNFILEDKEVRKLFWGR
jgi:type IV secretory pathway ATPase VirB11/archaellum biosynthesis ATPase|tara:strand:+ start:140 stop:505 length:366 start_codon:yes stop_codon:yes gene_type:complete